MSLHKVTASLLLLACSLALAGCFGGGGGESAAQPAKKSKSPLNFFKRGKSKNYETASANSSPARKTKSSGRTKSRRGSQTTNTLASADLGNMSPEGSMKRDLERLRDTEKQQVKTLAEMKKALNQGEDVVAKEEQKLHEIRGQIREFELAMQRYEGGGAGSRGRQGSTELVRYEADDDYAAPASMYSASRSDRPSRSSRQRADYAREPERGESGSGRANRYASYEQPTRPEEAFNAPSPYARQERRPSAYAGGREEMLFDSRDLPPAPAPVSPAPSARQAPDYDESAPWNSGGSLFSRSARPEAPQPLYRGGQDSMRPEPRRAPAAVSQPVSSRPAPSPAAAPAPRPVQAMETHDDDVFTPDLFLSGGR